MQAPYQLAIPVIWTGWVIYWTIAARNSKPVIRQESPASRAEHIIPLAAAIVLLALPPHLGGWLFERFLPPSLLFYWTGIALLVTGLAFSIWARRRLGGNWSGVVTLKQEHELVRDGPYGWVRHPIYTGLLVGFLGSAIALGQWRGLLSVALVAYAFLRKIRSEERWMIEVFQDRYTAYRKQVRALIPFVL